MGATHSGEFGLPARNAAVALSGSAIEVWDAMLAMSVLPK